MKPFAFELENKQVTIQASALPSPVVTFLVAEKRWRLEQAYSLRTNGHQITVPERFEFDLASVPRALWSLIAPFELSISAPLVHDFLYRFAGEPPAGSVAPLKVFSRPETDVVFRDTMEEEGVSAWRRATAYRMVRWFGSGAWGKALD
jgi:hypothetical protein